MDRGLLLLAVALPVLVGGVALVDVDGDGLPTLEEVRAGTGVLEADTDGDGLADGEETARGTDPRSADSDGDGLDDATELGRSTDPLVADSDRDGLVDGEEADLATDPLESDTDGDGVGDAREVESGTDPARADTDGDGLADGREAELGTDATAADTDGDGLSDDEEVTGETDPTVADTDDDGLDDGGEADLGTDPLAADSDDDGLADGEEVHRTDVLHSADPLRVDVYVEVDRVEGTRLPRSEVRRVVEAYGDAPVGAEGHRGISLHVVYNESDLEERGPVSVTGRPDEDGEDTVSVEAYKEDHYDYRGYGYHYLLVAPEVQDVPGSEVLGEAGDGEFVVQSMAVEDVRGSTLMHELGHSLGLDRHDFDGIDSREYTAEAYPSVMNYETGPQYYGYSAGEPFDDWSAIVEDLYVPDTSRLEGDAANEWNAANVSATG